MAIAMCFKLVAGGTVSCKGFDNAIGILVRPRRLSMLLVMVSALCACSQKNSAAPAPSAPPPAVSVINVGTAAVVLSEEYAAQTEAVGAVEIRSRVGGTLERQIFSDGAVVKRGGLLFVIDPQPYITMLAQAKAGLGQAQASHLNSRQNLARLRPLLADQAISQQDLDAAIAKERADAALVEAGRAQVQQAQLNLGYTSIRSPRDGVASKALIKPGGLVNASTTLLTTVYPLGPIYVNFTISEQKLVQLQKLFDPRDSNNRTPRFKLKLIDGSEYRYGGTLDFVDAAVDPKSGTLQVRISVPNPEGALRSGQFVRVIVPAQENPKAIVVPQKAVQELQGKHSVYVVGADNKVIYRDVKVTSRVGSDWVVESGLTPGELVVVEGMSKIKPGMQVKPILQAQQKSG
jgi:membrane fusion protein (multidrug efflux system)